MLQILYHLSTIDESDSDTVRHQLNSIEYIQQDLKFKAIDENDDADN